MMNNPHVQNASMRLGIVFHGQMEGYVRWMRSKDFRMSALHAVPEDVELVDEIIDEFVRFSIGGYVDGVLSTVRAGRPIPYAALGKKALAGFEGTGGRLGAAALHNIRTTVMPILEMAFDTKGRLVRPKDDLEKEIRSMYAPILRTAPFAWVDRVLELAEDDPDPVDVARDAIIAASVQRSHGRRMRVRSRAAYERWQKNYKPFSVWIKQAAEQLRAEGIAPPTVSPEYAVKWVQTERTEYFNSGVLEATEHNHAVVGYRFRANNGGSSEVCQRMHGLVIQKGDPKLGRWAGPLHHGCESELEAVYWDEQPVFARSRDFPPEEMIARGFGQTLRRLVQPKVEPRYTTRKTA